jgi:predicted alpha/beta hydrolase family esterase
VKKAAAQEIAIVAHSYGGVVVTHLVSDFIIRPKLSPLFIYIEGFDLHGRFPHTC